MVMDTIEKKLRKDIRSLKRSYIVCMTWQNEAGKKYFESKKILEMYLGKIRK